MKKIVVLHPPRYFRKIGNIFFTSYNLIRHSRGVDRIPGVTPPSEIALLATVLSQQYAVEVLDANALNLLPRDVIRFLLERRPDALVIRAGDSTFLDDVYFYHFAESVGICSIVWESHLSYGFAERIMNEFSIKRLVSGDPELIIPRIIDQNAVGYFHGQPFDISNVPAAKLDLLPMEQYIYENKRSWFIEQSRGCGWGKCVFCVRSRTGENALSYRKLSVIEEELDCAEKHGVRHIFFWGDDINSDPNRLKAICELMAKKKFSWECWMRVDQLDLQMACLMRQSGCERVTFGIESGDQDVLDKVNKGIDVEMIRSAFKCCQLAGLRPIASIFIGSPYDTSESLARTMKLLKEIHPAQLLVSCYRPFLETKLFETASKQGLVKIDLYKAALEGDFFGGGPLINSPVFTADDLDKWYKKFSRFSTKVSLRNYLMQPSKWKYALTQFVLKLIREGYHD